MFSFPGAMCSRCHLCQAVPTGGCQPPRVFWSQALDLALEHLACLIYGYCISPFSVAITKVSPARQRLKRRGLCSSQFWRLKVRDQAAPLVWPPVRLLVGGITQE